MTHNYHAFCGCASCCDDDEAAERREEAIAAATAALIAERMRDHEAIRDCLLDTSEAGIESILNACESFYVDVEVATGKSEADYIASAAVRLWRALRPYVESWLEDPAREDAEREYDRREAA